jgi:hypothetical protein
MSAFTGFGHTAALAYRWNVPAADIEAGRGELAPLTMCVVASA